MQESKPDYILIIAVALLLIFGILILTSVSVSFSQEKFGNPYYYLKRQILLGIIPGITLLFLAFYFPLKLLKKWAPFLLLINLILVAMVFLPKIGLTVGGATRWLSLGENITFQPSEFLKLTFILYLASWLTFRTSFKKSLKEKKISFHKNSFTQTLIAFLIIIGLISLLLILQPHISTLGIIILLGLLMYFLAGTPFWHSLLITLFGIGGLLYLIKTAAYRIERWLVFLNPEIDPMGIGYQLKQSLITIGSGGIFGLGLGMSRQKFGFLPQPMTDSIFAIFSEEAGFLGVIILISLFLIILWRGFKISKEVKDNFAKLAALGISSWLVLQAFVNIGSMIGILPLTGIPLPLISYGGSHLVAELIGIGILLNISKKI